MILGVLSDSHGQVQRTANAVRMLQRAGAEGFVHCGDVGGIEVVEELAGLRAWVVCGNTDCPDARLVRRAEALGVTVAHEGPLRLELDGRKLAAFHGHEPAFAGLIGVLSSRRTPPAGFNGCQYVLHGHTHVPNDARVGTMRIINPGALHRASTHTVATLDLRADQVRFWEVPDEPTDGPPREFMLDEQR